MHYPWALKMDSKEKEVRAIEMHNNSIETFIQMCNIFKVKESIPCAGPALVKNFNINLFPMANSLIFNKLKSLKKIQSSVNKTFIHNLKSADKLKYNV